MRDHGNRLPWVRQGQPRDSGHAAVEEVAQRLAARRAEGRIALSPALAHLRIALLDLGVGHAFEHTEAALAQARVGRDLAAATRRHSLRGLHRAQQVAGVDRVNAFIAHRQRQAMRLPAADVVERHVELALNARVHVPRRLAMADGENPGDLLCRVLHRSAQTPQTISALSATERFIISASGQAR